MSTTPPDNSLPPSYRVTSQQEEVAPGAAGTYTRGFRVYFALASGEQGSVFVPLNTYNVESVKTAVEAQARMLAAISSLGQ